MLSGVAAWRVASRLCRCRLRPSATIFLRPAHSVWVLPGPSASSSAGDDDSPVERLYTDPQVQELLRRLTGCDLDNKVYAPKRQKEMSRTHFAMMTDEQFEKTREQLVVRAQYTLRFPPLKEPRPDPKGVILSLDPEIAQFDQCPFIFTDTSFDTTDLNRTVAVREPDGTLRTATVEEHDRMNRVYYETPHRPVTQPALFSDPDLQNALNRNRHVLVLDYACWFFEITQTVYDRTLADEKSFLLHSTRHYGPFIFYHMINRNLPPLLNQANSIMAAATLIRLQKLMKPNWRTTVSARDDDLQVVKDFLEKNENAQAKLPKLVELLCKVSEPSEPGETTIETKSESKSTLDPTKFTWRDGQSSKTGTGSDSDGPLGDLGSTYEVRLARSSEEAREQEAQEKTDARQQRSSTTPQKSRFDNRRGTDNKRKPWTDSGKRQPGGPGSRPGGRDWKKRDDDEGGKD